MVKKTIPNQGRQSVHQFRGRAWAKLRRALVNPKTVSLLMGWLRVAVAIARLFDHWTR
ncbi:hypothetical protein [Burkholderia ubonensis]|uniref:hypothetical protein n=1 Tax=Burkholderia ubonensis TaxID=101571 RepID=UPI0012F96066|nr:hypothetical protein [Burkholderia ubonensis]